MVYARHGMACTSHPLGAQIGLDVMKAGGNAVDAAVAMAGAMPLLEPTGNGLGSDCFALVWMEEEKKLYGLNASGTAPIALSAEAVKNLGFGQMPNTGWIPTMVPGAPAGWAELNRRFGTKSLPELFAPAISYAREGCPVAVNLAPQWELDSKRIAAARQKDPAPHDYWWKSFLKEDGTPYRAGELFRWEEYAQTLEELAATGCESYYRGPLMERIVAFSRQTGGYFCEEDFKTYYPQWVEPITAEYKGYTVCELPPNGHGITVLMALNILKGLPLPEEKESADTYHKILESIKLAFADTRTYVADPRYMRTKVSDLLSEGYTARRRALITDRALEPQAGDPSCGGTIYLCAADPQG
ncbi:MAG: gamma-glutamyltransferase, partial [Lawsonibacter sp.]